jgi:NAD-dependent dihydropyrimidine dehydrogenase PreA subunit
MMEDIGKQKHIIYCNCGGERIPDTIKKSVETILQNSPVNYTKVSDLCGVSALRKDLVSGIFHVGTDYMVIGCYKRAMDQLFRQVASLPQMPGIKEHINLIEQSADDAAEKIASFCSNYHGTSEHNLIVEDSGWPAWYPVIDPERCTQCGQCADFCLFGVYEKSDMLVKVVNPGGCKNNCPACARICPSAAIIFPKYKHGGAIGGSDEIDEKEEQVRQVRDIENIMGNDLYEALERRKARRKSIIREEMLARAVTERDQALDESNKNY